MKYLSIVLNFQKFLSYLLFFYLIFIFFVFPNHLRAQEVDTLWSEDWEGNWEINWYIDYGTWEVGIPTSGPNISHSSDSCAATILYGHYGNFVDSTRLIRRTSFTVPASVNNPRLRFFHWYDFTINDDDYGKVQIKVVGNQNWEDLPCGEFRNRSGGIWTRAFIDLSDYAEQDVQIAFYFHSDNSHTSSGWYLDDLSIETGDLTFNDSENWESGFHDWYVDYGTWDVGSPGMGPETAYSGQNCVGTILDDVYWSYVDTRLISPPVEIPPADKNPRLRFFHWYDFTINDEDYGKVQIKVIGNQNWEDLPAGEFRNRSGGIWTKSFIDLSDYAGLKVQIAFYFHSDDYYTSLGWYIDDVSIETGLLVFNNPECWETGFNDWYVDYGTWDVGPPIIVPDSAYQGENCVGTILDDNYWSYTDTRLTSPPVEIPPADKNPRLRFYHWYDFKINDEDYGKVQIKVIGNQNWEDLPNGEFRNRSGDIWTRPFFDLYDYAGLKVQIAFYFHSDDYYTSLGWYLDCITIEVEDGYPPLSISPNSLNFGRVFVDDNVTKEVTVLNNCGMSLYVVAEITGVDSSILNLTPSTFLLDPRESKEISVTFSPQNTDSLNAVLKIMSIGGGAIVEIFGTGDIGPGVDKIFNNDIQFSLTQNYPNPFNPTTTIHYQLPSAANVELLIYNSLGQKVRSLVSGRQNAGYHQIAWNAMDDKGTQVSSGVYFYRLTAGKFVQTKKMLLMR